MNVCGSHALLSLYRRPEPDSTKKRNEKPLQADNT